MTLKSSNNHNEQDDQLDLIARTVVEKQQDIKELNEVVAKTEDLHKMNCILDEILGLVKKKGQELIFMGDRVKHVEKDVGKIMPIVGLA